MSRKRRYSGRELCRVLDQKALLERQSGSHRHYRYTDSGGKEWRFNVPADCKSTGLLLALARAMAAAGLLGVVLVLLHLGGIP